ncbi:nSTAND1 domain-containing NTPase [Sorangium sp. So ce388]|uniref:nSTAND1 domain-containing NTPase n=1 Tax=Sorangium sp. So ce388 TaxID=3133309 RepID=UPI003F5BA76C
MDTFEITIRRHTGEGFPIVAEHGSGLRSRAEALIVAIDQARLLALDNLPREYGVELGASIFLPAIQGAFERARQQAPEGLHVVLCVEDRGLRGLRWERLCARLGAPVDGGWDFLSRNQHTPFSTHVPTQTDRRFPLLSASDQRALALVASPAGLPQSLTPFDVAEVVGAVREGMLPVPCDVVCDAAAGVEGAIDPPTLEALSAKLSGGGYTQLHIVCHGAVTHGQTVLYWADAAGRTRAVTGKELLATLSRVRGVHGLPQLIFLSACHSATSGSAFTGLAESLVVELGIPAVIAMVDLLPAETASVLHRSFYRRLRATGLVDVALAEACAGIAGEMDALAPILLSRLGARPLFVERGAPPGPAAIERGLGLADGELARRAPALKEAFSRNAATIRATLSTPAENLAPDLRRERDAALAAVDEICREAVDLRFDDLAGGVSPPTYDGTCPFPGLSSFGFAERAFFFGRRELIRKLAEKLQASGFLAVLGASGSGKSSLVLAGLLPHLGLDPARFAQMKPGSAPLAMLENVWPRDGGAGKEVLFVDQFEEVFTQCESVEQRRDFFSRLLEIGAGAKIVLTMRVDFWGDCAPYTALKDQIQRHQELVAPMALPELRDAMEEQARAVGLRFEPDLANTLLEDVEGEPGAMPLLQHALRALWQQRHGRWLKVSRYRALGRDEGASVGGAKGAIAATAEGIYRTLTPAEQELARGVFQRLARVDVDPRADEVTRDARQRVKRDDLVPADGDAERIKALVARLADERLVMTSVNRVTNDDEVEISHEALLRYWGRLRSWIDQDRASLIVRHEVAQAQRAWEAGGKSRDLLVHQGERLVQAEKLRGNRRTELNQGETEYLDACTRKQRREAYVRVGGLAVIFLLLCAVAGSSAWFARKDRKGAEVQRDLADRASRGLYAAQLGRAKDEENDGPEMLRMLAALRPNNQETPDLRGFEWYYLWGKSREPLFLLRRFRGLVKALAYDPRQQLLAAGSDAGEVRLFDLKELRKSTNIQDGASRPVNSIVFSPLGTYMAAANDHTVQVYKGNGYERFHIDSWRMTEIPLVYGPVSALAFSPDEDLLAVGTDAGTLSLYEHDLGVAAERWLIDSLTAPVARVAFTATDDEIAITSQDERVELRAVDDGSVLPLTREPERNVKRSWCWIRVNHNGAALTRSDCVIIDENDAYAEEAEYAATSGTRAALLRHEPIDIVLSGYAHSVLLLELNPLKLAITSDDNELFLYDAQKTARSRAEIDLPGLPLSRGFSPDGRQAFAAALLRETPDTSAGTVTVVVVDTSTGVEIRRSTLPENEARYAVLGDGGESLVTLRHDGDGSVRSWDLTRAPAVPAAWDFAADTRVESLALSTRGTRGTYVAAIDRERRLRVARIKPTKGIELRDEIVVEGAIQAAFDLSGDRLAVAAGESLIMLESETGARRSIDVAHQSRSYNVSLVRFAPDGASIIAHGVGEGGAARIFEWMLATDTLESSAATGAIPARALHPDGSRIADALGNRIVIREPGPLGSANHHQLLVLDRAFQQTGGHAEFSPDGRTLIAPLGGGIELWHHDGSDDGHGSVEAPIHLPSEDDDP